MPQLLSDEEVFGAATPAAKPLLSDEEVFGAPTPKAKRPVGAAEAFGRSAMDSMAAIPSFVNALFGQVARPVDALLGTNIRESLTDPAGPVEQARKAWQLNNQTEQLDGTMAQVAQGLGPLPRDMGLAIMTGGGSLGAQSALKAAPMAGEAITRLNAVKSLAPELLQGAKAMMAPAALSSRDTYNQARTEGADPRQAAALGTVRGLGTVAQGALPLSVAGNLATRVGSSVALNLPANMLQTQAENAVAPASMQRNTFDVADNATAMGVGAIMAALLGPHAGRIQTPAEISNIRRTDNMNKWGIDRTDGYGPELEPVEPAAPRAPEPYAADPYAVNPKQATADLNEKLFPAPDEVPDLKLVPKVGDGALFSTKSNPDPASIPSKLTLEGDGPNRILSDGDARNIEKVLGMSEAEVTALPRPAQEALRDHANSFVERAAQEVMTGRPDGGMDAVRSDGADGDTINSRPLTPRPDPARLQEPQQRAPQAEQPAADTMPLPKAGNAQQAPVADHIADAGKMIAPKSEPTPAKPVVSPDTKAYPHPTVDGQYAIRERVEPAAKESLKPAETPINPKDSTGFFEQSSIIDNAEPRYKSKDKLINMSIDEFLKLSERLDSPDAEKAAGVRKLVDSGTKLSSIPYLYFKKNDGGMAEVTGHEGRHRAMQIRSMGYTHIPVIFRGDIRWSEQSNNSKFDYVEQWPTKLQGQNGDVVDFPVTREASADSFQSAQGQKKPSSDVAPINPDQKGASLGQEKTPQEVLTKTAPKESDPTAGIPKGMFTKVKDVEYDAGSGKKVGTAKEAMRDLNRSLSDYQAFLDCLRG